MRFCACVEDRAEESRRRLNVVPIDDLLASHQGAVGRHHHRAHLDPRRLERWVGRGWGGISGCDFHVVVNVGA